MAEEVGVVVVGLECVAGSNCSRRVGVVRSGSRRGCVKRGWMAAVCAWEGEWQGVRMAGGGSAKG